jgi:hypothetical protein
MVTVYVMVQVAAGTTVPTLSVRVGDAKLSLVLPVHPLSKLALGT